MLVFEYLTPLISWAIIALWTFIFVFYVGQMRRRRRENRLLFILLLVLSIDAFRTLFESAVFGAWYASVMGAAPAGLRDFIERPEVLFIPRWVNFMAAAIIITLLVRRWLPEESRERSRHVQRAGELEALVQQRTRELSEDIARREAAESALRSSERRLATLMSNLPGMSYRCANDRDFTMEYVSEGCTALTGYLPADVINNKKVAYADLIHPDDRDAVWDTVQQALDIDSPFQMMYRLRTASGVVRWVWEQGRAVYDDTGTFTALEGFITDISEQVEARLALEHESAFNAKLIQTSPVYYVALDSDGNIIMMNTAMLDATGRSQEEVLEKDYMRLFVPREHRAEVGAIFQRLIKRDDQAYLESDVLTREGRRLQVEWHGRTVRKPDGSFDFFFGMGIDVTERRRLERFKVGQTAILERIASGESLPEVIDAVIRLLESQSAGVTGAVYLYDGASGRPRLAGAPGLPEAVTERLDSEDFARGPGRRPGAAVAAGTQVVVPDLSEEPGWAALGPAGADFRGYWSLPIQSGDGEVLGALDVHAATPGPPGPEELSLAEACAHMLRIALEGQRATRALRASEARFRNVLEQTRDLLYRIDLREMRYDFVSGAALDVTGFTPEELRAIGPREAIERTHPEERAAVRGQFRRSLVEESGEAGPLEVEYRWEVKGGGYRWISESRSIIRDEDGRAAAIVGSVRDVTPRKEAEAAMTRLRRYLRSIIDAMPSVLIGVDAGGAVTHWNAAASAETGCAAEEALGKPFASVYPLEAEVEAEVRAALASREILESRRFSRHEGPDGTQHFELMFYPLAEEGGGVIRVDDVTARVEFEETMVQTEKMMSVGGLAAGMAHEINNPLGGILQSCQNIERRISPELARNRAAAEAAGIDLAGMNAYLEARGVREFLRGIRADGARAAKIVADMLSYSRRGGTMQGPARIEEMAGMVVRLAMNDYDLKRQYDFKRIQILQDLDPSLPEIRCDKIKIEQVLLNLVKNAAQAIAEQEASGTRDPAQERPCITLRTRRESGHARIEVEDNGPGMEESVRRRVFDPFFTTKEVGTGTGLGLSVSYFIITKQHKGTLAVESAPGQGTRFIIRLPLEAAS